MDREEGGKKEEILEKKGKGVKYDLSSPRSANAGSQTSCSYFFINPNTPQILCRANMERKEHS